MPSGSSSHATAPAGVARRPRPPRDIASGMPRALVPLLAITFVDVLGFTILIPILPFYAEHFGASPTTVGAIYSTVAVASLLSSPFWGRLSDRIGRKGVLIAAQVAGLLGFSLLAAERRCGRCSSRARSKGWAAAGSA